MNFRRKRRLNATSVVSLRVGVHVSVCRRNIKIRVVPKTIEDCCKFDNFAKDPRQLSRKTYVIISLATVIWN